MGKALLIAQGDLTGVIQGINIATGLLLLSVVLGLGMIKIPIKLWQKSNFNRTWKYI